MVSTFHKVICFCLPGFFLRTKTHPHRHCNETGAALRARLNTVYGQTSWTTWDVSNPINGMSTTNLNRFSNAGNHQISLAAGNLVLLRPGVVGVPPRKDPNHSFRQLGQPNLGWPERSSYQVGFLGRFFFLGGKHAYLYTWNPNDPCFVWKGPCFGGFNLQNRGQTGSRCILYIYIIYIYMYII